MIHLATLLAASGPTTTAAAAHKAGTSILDPIAKPIAALLAFIYGIIPNYGVAIMILSVLWMLIIAPLTLKSTRSMLAMQKLQPQLKRLQQQHKDDKQAFAEAQMALFREHGVSPFGSCLPMLLPMPVFFALFRVIDGLSHTVNGQPEPKYLSHSTRMYHDIVAAHGQINAFGMNLADNAFSHHSSFAAALPFWILVLVLAGTGYLQSAMMMSRNPAQANNPQARLMKYLPLVFTVVFIRFPAGVLLYYAMSNICRIVQQDLMYRFDPKVKALVAQEIQEVETLTHEIDEKEGNGRRPGGGGGRAGTRGAGGAGGAGSGGAGSGGAGSKGGTSGKRSRFGDLLAAAAEQQKKKPSGSDGTGSTGGTGSGKAALPPAGGTSGSPGTSGRPPTSNGTSSKRPTNGSNGSNGRTPVDGQPSGSNNKGKSPPASSGHKTNRKRRGR